MSLLEQFKRYSAAVVIALAAGASMKEAEAQTPSKSSAISAKSKATPQSSRSATFIKAFEENGGSYFVYGEAAKPIVAYTAFCQEFREKCSRTAEDIVPITLTPGLLLKIEKINRDVNKSIRPVTDFVNFGKIDIWTEPKNGMGDCEDIQLEKARILEEMKLVPRSAMKMIVVVDDTDEGHAVLGIRTNKGDLVLDNKTGEVLFAKDIAYPKHVKSVFFANSTWRRIEDVKSYEPVTANSGAHKGDILDAVADSLVRINTFVKGL